MATAGLGSAGSAGAVVEAGDGGAAALASIAGESWAGACWVADPSGCATAAAPPITATTVLICTVEPSGILISVSTPETGAGISASTLSVDISNSGSSF